MIEPSPESEGYQRCYCGEWAVGFHKSCASLVIRPAMTPRGGDRELQ